MQIIDFIGDIHGHANALEALLKHLGYQKRNNYYYHPERKAFFVGDYIDRGPQIPETLEIIKAMVDNGAAQALMGNHEFNAVCFNLKSEDCEYLRPHTLKNITQHLATIEQFKNRQEAYDDYIEWFKTLPLFFENESFRAVHACWDYDSIEFLKNQLANQRLSPQQWQAAGQNGNRLFNAVEIILKGKEMKMPVGLSFTDKDGHERKEFRIKWWESPEETTIRELSIIPMDSLPDQIEKRGYGTFIPYPKDGKPVFFGHYWLKGEPNLFRGNICCLDYSIAKNGFLSLYPYSGEKELRADKFIYTGSNGNVYETYFQPDKDHFIACVLGGAIGDALGAPVEFQSYEEIQSLYPPAGVIDYVEFNNGKGEFTDDTQMTLFTAEGLLRAYHRAVQKGIEGALIQIMHYSYLRWLHTQGDLDSIQLEDQLEDELINSGFLLGQKILYKRRAPGNTCLSALQSGEMGSINRPLNNSKGCGTIMRMAPVGLIFKHDPAVAFKEGVNLSALTHGHPSGYLAGGFFAAVIAVLAYKRPLQQAISTAKEILVTYDSHEEVLEAVNLAERIHHNFRGKEISYLEIEQLGGGWIAEEALAISLLCALHYANDFRKAVLSSIHHSGDSDSTGSITGNLMGLMLGTDAIPESWKENLNGRELVEEIGEDLFLAVEEKVFHHRGAIREKYPPF